MVRLCFTLLLLHKHKYRIQMPRGFMDDFERGVAHATLRVGDVRVLA